MNEEPAFNVVVFRNPGPDEHEIPAHAQTVAENHYACGLAGGLGYVTRVMLRIMNDRLPVSESFRRSRRRAEDQGERIGEGGPCGGAKAG